jgi:hypothetical protein
VPGHTPAENAQSETDQPAPDDPHGKGFQHGDAQGYPYQAPIC